MLNDAISLNVFFSLNARLQISLNEMSEIEKIKNGCCITAQCQPGLIVHSLAS
jgi:hypothetical protein